MYLSDTDIKKEWASGRIDIRDFNPANVNPNSYDITLDDTLRIYRLKDHALPNGDVITIIDPSQPLEEILIPEHGLILFPSIGYLGVTKEFIGTDHYAPMIEGRSSTGRLFISIHPSSGVGDAGFYGHFTLEITCTQPVLIHRNMKIGQVLFATLSSPASVLYRDKVGSKYHGYQQAVGWKPDKPL